MGRYVSGRKKKMEDERRAYHERKTYLVKIAAAKWIKAG
jgi:hypothetical protein